MAGKWDEMQHFYVPRLSRQSRSPDIKSISKW